MKIDHEYAREKLFLLLRDLDRYNGDEFWRQMSRIAHGATDNPSAEGLLKERDALAAHLERITQYKNRLEAKRLMPARLAGIIEESPASSLARRDLLNQAEALELISSDVKLMHPKASPIGISVHIGIEAKKLRQQAKELD